MKFLLSTAIVLGLALCVVLAKAEEPPKASNDRVRIVYAEPQNEKQRLIRDAMQKRRILETVGELLSAFRLPRELVVEARGCDGREGAWYAYGLAVFCYEYVELIQRHSPKVATPGGVARADAIVGGVIDTVLHEVGHGIIEILDIPVLGREEDAADFFSIYLLLQFPTDDARRLIHGVAFSMGSEGREDLRDKGNPQLFAGAHPPNAQRHYNVLCLAFGANPAMFNDIPPAGLPSWRARNSCGDEWALLKRGFEKLILPHVDVERLREVITKTQFGWSPLVVGNSDKPPLE